MGGEWHPRWRCIRNRYLIAFNNWLETCVLGMGKTSGCREMGTVFQY